MFIIVLECLLYVPPQLVVCVPHCELCVPCCKHVCLRSVDPVCCRYFLQITPRVRTLLQAYAYIAFQFMKLLN